MHDPLYQQKEIEITGINFCKSEICCIIEGIVLRAGVAEQSLLHLYLRTEGDLYMFLGSDSERIQATAKILRRNMDRKQTFTWKTDRSNKKRTG